MIEREFDEPATLARVREIFAAALYVSGLGVTLLLRPARGKELRCTATVFRPGRTISVVESELFADGILVAKLTATLAMVAAGR